MKKTLFFAALMAVAMTGCVKENSQRGDSALVPVSLRGSASGIENRAAVNAGEQFTARVIASAASGDFTTLYASGSPLADFDQTVTFAAATGAAALSPAQYYPIDGLKYVYIKGFAPETGVRTGNTVAYTIDGTQDIMVSNEAQGNKSNSSPLHLTFGHLLTQVKFVVVAENAVAAAAWGNITGIEILNQNKALDLNLGTNVLSVNAVPQNGTIAVASSAADLTIAAADAGYAMFFPMSGLSAAAPLKLNVRTANLPAGQSVDITSVTGGTALAPGTAYTVTLTFKVTEILISATVTPWVAGGDQPVSVD